ncbi:MAG: cytochrome c [Planctomycetaceae bacterium]|nr:cytochrome c [Planctomycetaceae bacterium]
MRFLSSCPAELNDVSSVDGRVGVFSLVCVAVALGFAAGCERAAPLEWKDTKAMGEMSEEHRELAREILVEYSGNAANPRVLAEVVAEKRAAAEAEEAAAGEDAAEAEPAEEGQEEPVEDAGPPSLTREQFVRLQQLKHGQQVYTRRCVQCHGESGGGDGPAADMLYPRPRDYTAGTFKFTSTPYDYRPLRSDLVDTVRRGIRGTSMPSFSLLPDEDIEAVIDYVIVLTQRGELSSQVAEEAAFLEDDFKQVEDMDHFAMAELVSDRWEEASHSLTQPLTPEPELTREHVERGRQAFLTKGCNKCHGDDGRGHTPFRMPNDVWGYPTRAADLTSGMLRGGQRPIDVYRRILNGINGTPMPGFVNALRDEPDTIWDLVGYVLYVSNRRRAQNEISAGLMKPFEYVAGTEEADAEGASGNEEPADGAE